MKAKNLNRRLFVALAVVMLALVLRVTAVTRLPLDYDEPVYLNAAGEYAVAVASGDWGAVLRSTTNLEHPLLVKLAYAAGLLAAGPNATQAEALLTARFISAGFGSLAAGALALASPIAGVALALHTMTIKYTSQAYLEALPLLSITLAALAYRHSGGRRGRWFWLSAVMLGVTAASKYTYLVAGLALLPFLFLGLSPAVERPGPGRGRRWLDALLYLLLAGAIFLLLDPILWPNPPLRLWQSLTYHVGYTQGADVQRAAYPWYQQWLYMSRSVPWHPGVFLVSLDTLVFLMGLLGLPYLLRREPLMAAWLITGWVWLTVWPTRWPQYTLIIVTPLAISAGLAVQFVLELAEQQGIEWRKVGSWLPGRSFWLVLLAVLVVMVGFYTFFGIERVLERRYWTTFSTQNSGLPADAVQAVAVVPAGPVWLGTPEGLARWRDSAWQVLTSTSSGLADDDVRALYVDAAGALWVGTRDALQVLEGGEWRTVADGLLVTHITGDDSGRIWATSTSGLLRVEGDETQLLTEADGLPADRLLDAAMAPDGRLWLASHLGAAAGNDAGWSVYTRENSGLSWSGVASVAVDGRGRVWLGTFGGGVTVVDGEEWRTYTTANSGLPWNFVTRIVDDGQGQLWFGADLPAGSGGNLASFDYANCGGRPDQCPDAWQVFTPLNSGVPGSGVAAIAADAYHQIWVGTRSAGVSVYRVP